MNKLLGSTAIALLLAGAATATAADDATATSRTDPITGAATTTGDAPGGATTTAPANDGSVGDATSTSRTDPLTGADRTGAANSTTNDPAASETSSGEATATSRTDPLTGADRTGEPFVHAGYSETDSTRLLERDLDDAKVYGRNDETIGTISEVMVGTNGMITDAVIDVGGILGLGVHSVSVPYSDLKVLQEDGGDKIRVYSETSKAEFEAMPAYKG